MKQNYIKISIASIFGLLLFFGIYSCSYEHHNDYIIENDSGSAVTIFFRPQFGALDSAIIGTNITQSFFIDFDGFADVAVFDSISLENADGKTYSKDALDSELWEVVDIKKYEKTLTLTLVEEDFE